MRKKKPKKKPVKDIEPKSIEDLSPMDPRAMERWSGSAEVSIPRRLIWIRSTVS